MSQPDLEKFDQRAIIVAQAGTSLSHASHGLQLLQGTSQKQADAVTRELDKPYLGASVQPMTNFRATINGTLELRPPQDPGHASLGIPPTDNVIRPCGLARTLASVLGTTTYNVVSSGFTLADANWWHSGLYLEVRDAAGDLSNLKIEIGQAFTATLALTGNYTELGEEALPTDVDLTAFVGSPTVAEPENTVMLISTAESADLPELHLWGKSLTANLGHSVNVKRYSELRQSGITGRAANYTAVFAKTALADFNPDAYFRNRKVLRIVMRVKEADGRYSALGVLGTVDSYSETDVEGDLCFQIQGACTPVAPGNNEVYVEFGYDGFALRGGLSDGEEGAVYDDGVGISSINGTGTVTYALASGSAALPTGLSIASTGAITGTPGVGTAGDYTITVEATDSDSPANTCTRDYTFTVAP